VATVHSSQFWAGPVSTSSVSSGAVPPGFIWIVRDVTAVFVASSSDELQVISEVSGVGWFFDQSDTDRMGHWEGRQVLYEGDSLSLVSVASDWLVGVSGYILSLP